MRSEHEPFDGNRRSEFFQPNPFAHSYGPKRQQDEINTYNTLRENKDCPDSLRQAIDVLHEKLDTAEFIKVEAS